MTTEEPGTRNREAGRGFRGLLAWQRADDLASAVYRSFRGLPNDHRWLTTQAMRAAISVPANIAEGYGRGSLGDYLRFLDIARGSLAELEYYLLFCAREGLLDETEAERLESLREKTSMLLHGLWRSLKQKLERGDWNRTGVIKEERAGYLVDSQSAEPGGFKRSLVPGSWFPVPEEGNDG